MFEKILPFLMYGLMVTIFVLAATGLIVMLNLVLALFGFESFALSRLNVGLLALLIGVGVSFLR